MTLPHDAGHPQLSAYLDDDLTASERTTVELHLERCALCRNDLFALRQVVARAARLPDMAPSTDLWPGVAAAIQTVAQQGRTELRRRFSFTLPQLVAAGLALMVLSGGMVWIARLGGAHTDLPPLAAEGGAARPEPPASGPNDDIVRLDDRATADQEAELELALQAGRAALDLETARVLEDNLAVLDRAIAECRRALADDPASVHLDRQLSVARTRKLQLLRQAAALVRAPH